MLIKAIHKKHLMHFFISLLCMCLCIILRLRVVSFSAEVEPFQPKPTYSPTEPVIRLVPRTSPAPPYDVVTDKSRDKHKPHGNQKENEAIQKGTGE